VLEIVRRTFCDHVAVLPEAAGIVYGGGFPRKASGPMRKAAQRSIYHVQREIERAVIEEDQAALALCDRGTVDGLAYWPESEASYWAEVGSSLEQELSRYAAVIQLRTPVVGYNHRNPLRIESAVEAAAIDGRIAAAWARHPRRYRALDLVRAELPECCRLHSVTRPLQQDPLPVTARDIASPAHVKSH
jgi:hypothetical protein